MDLDRSLVTAEGIAHRSRLLILNALRPGPLCAEEVAVALDLAPSTVSFHLKKLAAVGLVSKTRDQYYAVYSLSTDMLALSLGDLISFDDSDASNRARRAQLDRARVIAAFFDGGRLLRIPTQKRKRLIVLELIACLFTPGATYPESEVDARILGLYPDCGAIRRLLCDEGFFSRDRGLYRRTSQASFCALPGPDSPDALAAALTNPTTGVAPMDARKKALKRDYMHGGRQAGLFRITNQSTGRSLHGSSLDVLAALNRSEFELTQGSHRDRGLQADFSELGRDAFAFEVAATVEDEADPAVLEHALDALEAQYVAQVDWDQAYNSPPSSDSPGGLRVPPKRRRRFEPQG